MGIFDRISNLVRANVNDLLDRAEDPEKMLEQILRDMQEGIGTAKSQVAAMIAQEKELEADYNDNAQLAAEWGEKAKRAVAAGKDDLAREALRRKKDADENAAVYKQQLDIQTQTVEKLKSQLNQLESKYQTTVSQKQSLIARQRRAEVTKKVTQQATATVSSLSPLDASSELDRIERKIRSNEAEAAAYQEIGDNSFDTQFKELDYDVDIEKELEALKAGNSDVAGEIAASASASDDDDAKTTTYKVTQVDA
ncbi:MAG: PspA/IM30 family protein [Thermomicrobiales bacterium]